MPAQPSVDDSFTFVGGLNTEGGYFITPKNSWKEGDNVVPSTDGSITRRKALDYEENYQLFANGLTTTDVDNSAFSVSVWESVNGNGNVEFFVVQAGYTIHFYLAASGPVSATKKPFTIDLRTYQCVGNQSIIGSNVITAASCYGKLIITSVDTEPLLVVYDDATDTITTTGLNLYIRDFKGIRSPVADNIEYTQAEWTALNPTFWPHALYNLYNQGWKNTQLNAYTAAKAGKYPANTKQWVYGKNVDDNFDVSVLDKQDFGTSLAPKGRVILRAFYQDRASAVFSLEDATSLEPIMVDTPNFNDGRVFAGQGGVS